ncbi:MAG: hypothetical protein ACT4O0_03160 [Pseudonocardia sp.]
MTSGARPWDHVGIPLASSTSVALWLVLAGDAPLLAWLVAVHAGTVACSGPACTVATLGDHPSVQLVVTAAAVSVLTICAAVTRGLTRANSWQLGLLTVAGAAGSVALLGVLALGVALAAAMVLALSVVVYVVDRV